MTRHSVCDGFPILPHTKMESGFAVSPECDLVRGAEEVMPQPVRDVLKQKKGKTTKKYVDK